jgi:hypothetical protein
MKVDFRYSTCFQAMNAPDLRATCVHLLCTAGEGSFVFNERCYHIVKNDLVVIPSPNRVSNLAPHADMQVEWFAADYKFLQSLLPANNYSIGGSISLNQDPVIKLTDVQARSVLADFHNLRDRMGDRHLLFYRELMGSLCLTMMYDIFEAHAQHGVSHAHSDRTAYIVKQLMALLATGISRTERDVSYYAYRLNVSPKYLSATVKRVTGHILHRPPHRAHTERLPERRPLVAHPDSRNDEFFISLLLQPLLHQAPWPVAQRVSPEPSAQVSLTVMGRGAGAPVWLPCVFLVHGLLKWVQALLLSPKCVKFAHCFVTLLKRI